MKKITFNSNKLIKIILIYITNSKYGGKRIKGND